ncbi:hypothetical protein LX36DRAFT_34513 [Colletotrichum falcatum]|nr:hypothetical protein LX36DRAFT_34513 [Colletotrichum falcatum]
MSSYRRSDPNEGRRATHDRFNGQFDYQNRRDGETDRRDRARDFYRSGSRSPSPDRERNYRERDRNRERERERDRDRTRDLENLRPPPGPRENRPQHRTVSSPVHNKSSNSADPRLNRGPEPLSSIPTTPASSAPPTPHVANDSSSMAKITAALRQLTQRSNEQGALQLRKDVVEARARAREREHAQAHPKYAEFPSLKDYHRKLEKRDAEDLNALSKEVGIADKQWLTAAERFAAILFQSFAELQQQEKHGHTAAPSSENPNSRMDALDKQYREEAAKQQKQIEDLQKWLSFEATQRKRLDMENENLKQKVQELQNQRMSLTTKVDEHDTSIKRLQDEKAEAVPLPRATQTTTITSGDLAEVKIMVDQCRTELSNLEAKVAGQDQKLGEMDVDLITEGCYSLVATLPRLEQNAKRAADDISVLRTDYGKLRADNDKLRLDTDGLQSGVQQLQSGTEQLRSDALVVQPSMEQLKSDTDQLKVIAEQLKSELGQVRSDMGESQVAVEKRRSTMQELPAGDSFLSVKTFTKMNTAVFKTFSGWVDDLKKRTDAVESSIRTLQTASKQPNDHSSQINAMEARVKTLENGGLENSRVPMPAPDQGAIEYEKKWKEHDARLNSLEAISRKNPCRTSRDASEPLNAADALAHRLTQKESMNGAVEALKAQVAMTDQSLKAVSESAKLTSQIHAAQAQRIGQIEGELSRRLGAAEQAVQAMGERVGKRLDFMQQNFTSLDSQMNNLTTESLFQAIVQYIDRYQPGDAVIGHKRSVTPSDEPASKKRKVSPYMGQVSTTNGSR